MQQRMEIDLRGRFVECATMQPSSAYGDEVTHQINCFVKKVSGTPIRRDGLQRGKNLAVASFSYSNQR